MAASYVLAIDLGTSGARCLVCHPDGTPVSVARGTYELHTPPGGPDLARQFRPPQLWDLIATLVRQATDSARVTGRYIAAVGITSQRQGMALLDARGRELYVGPNLDLRAVFEGAAMDEALGQEVYRTTGHLPSFFFAPAKLVWFRNHQPRAWRRVCRVLTLAAWAAYRLTCEAADEPALLGEAGLLDMKTRQPAYALLKGQGLDPALLAPAVLAGNVAGAVTPSAGRTVGLRPGTPVALAGPDTQAALLAMGVTQPGEVGIVSGWSAPVQMVTSSPVLDQLQRTWAGCHLLPGRWVVEASSGDSGHALETLRHLVAPGTDYSVLESEAASVPLGSDGVTAFLGPRPMDLAHSGPTLGGLLVPVPLTHQPISRGHLVRATLENVGYALRGCLELVETVAEQRATAIHLGGGMAAGRLFPQMLADILERPLRVHGREVSGMGAALSASAAAGLRRDLAGPAPLAEGANLEPDPLAATEYRDQCQRWQALRCSLDQMWSGEK